MGVPVALQELLVGTSFLVIQTIVTTFGVTASAGVGVAEKVCVFLMLVPSAYMHSMSAFVAQNMGAGQPRRAKRALGYGILTAFAAGLVMAWLAFFHGDALSLLFAKDAAVAAASHSYLKAYAIDCMLTPFLFCFMGYYNGCEKTLFVMIQGVIGAFGVRIPIAGMAGDQQAALFGQGCFSPGDAKNTYGTGCFLLMNSGEKPIASKNNLLTTIAWKIGDKVNYALEGSIFVGGSVVQWLRDGLGIIRSSSEVEALAASVPDTGGVYFVPALTGLAAPHWDQYARGAISGISRGTTAAHIARAALEGIAYQTLDIVGAMQRDAGVSLVELKVDGGAARNDLLMQFQADLLATKVIRPRVTETTALGAAYLAGLAVGYWESVGEIRKQWQAEHIFEPAADRTQIAKAVAGWEDAVRRVLREKND